MLFRRVHVRLFVCFVRAVSLGVVVLWRASHTHTRHNQWRRVVAHDNNSLVGALARVHDTQGEFTRA